MHNEDRTQLKRLSEALKLVNQITALMEDNKIEEALPLIFEHYKNLPLFPKKILTNNILEAHTQYDLRKIEMPEDFYDFLASHDSDELFFPNGLV